MCLDCLAPLLNGIRERYADSLDLAECNEPSALECPEKRAVFLAVGKELLSEAHDVGSAFFGPFPGCNFAAKASSTLKRAIRL